jgi:acetyl-CoA carboxylase beta subunit
MENKITALEENQEQVIQIKCQSCKYIMYGNDLNYCMNCGIKIDYSICSMDMIPRIHGSA